MRRRLSAFPRGLLWRLALLLCLTMPAYAWAAPAAPSAPSASSAPSTPDAALDARVHALSQQLRCLVCQNQTLADSNADLAVDLRRQMRAQLAQGASEDAVRHYLVQRYGDFILYDPPFKPSTWLLWLGPFALLAAVVAHLWWRSRRPRVPTAALPQDSIADAPPVPAPDRPPARPRSRWTTATLCVALPPAAALLYLHLGNPAAVMQSDGAHSLSGASHAPDIAQIEAMVDQLARRLRAKPQDAGGWVMLARSYTVLERFDDAAAAYARAVALAPRWRRCVRITPTCWPASTAARSKARPWRRSRPRWPRTPTIRRPWRWQPARQPSAATRRRPSFSGSTCTGCCRPIRKRPRASPPISPQPARPSPKSRAARGAVTHQSRCRASCFYEFWGCRDPAPRRGAVVIAQAQAGASEIA